MRARGVTEVATFNLKHFRRFGGLVAQEPAKLATESRTSLQRLRA